MPRQRFLPQLPATPPSKKPAVNQPFRAGDAVLHRDDIVGREHQLSRRHARDLYRHVPGAAAETRASAQTRIDSGRYVNEDKAARGSIDRPERRKR